MVRVRRPRAATPDARMVEVTEDVPDPSCLYRGRRDVRWQFKVIDGKARFQVAGLCRCGRWWGWTDEGREGELVELLTGGCPKCSIE